VSKKGLKKLSACVEWERAQFSRQLYGYWGSGRFWVGLVALRGHDRECEQVSKVGRKIRGGKWCTQRRGEERRRGV